MSEWWKYSPEDLLLFSPRVYYRLLELHNEAWWPLQIIALALGIAITLLLIGAWPKANQWIAAILGALWIWVAWSFLWERFATVHWAVAYIAPLFAVQGAILLAHGAGWRGLEFSPLRWQRLAAAALFTAVLLYPLLALWEGRSIAGAETFGMFPDPTAVATLAVLAAMRRGLPLTVIPLLWCLLSSETLSLLHAPGFFVPATGAVLALFIHLAGRFCLARVAHD